MREGILQFVAIKKYWDLIITVFFKLSGTAVGAVSAIVLAWGYGDEGVGVFAMLRTLPLLLGMLTDLGVSHSYSFLINRKGYPLNSVVITLVVAAACSGVVQIAIGVSIGEWVAGKFGLGLGTESLLWCSILAPVMMVQVHVVNLLRARDDLRSANIFLVGCELIILAGVLFACIYSKGSVDFIAYSLSISSLCIFMLCCLLIARQMDWGAGQFLTGYLLEGVKFGIRSQLGNLMQVMSYRFDQLVIGALLGVSSLGVYVVASKVAELFKVFSLALVFVLEPKISRMDLGSARSYVIRSVGIVYLMNFVVVLAGFLIGPIIIELAFDEWAKEAVMPFFFLLSGLIFVGGNGLFAAYNLGVGRPGLNSYAIMVGMVSSVALNFLLVPVLGLNGAALSSAIACLLTAFCYFYTFKRQGAG